MGSFNPAPKNKTFLAFALVQFNQKTSQRVPEPLKSELTIEKTAAGQFLLMNWHESIQNKCRALLHLCIPHPWRDFSCLAQEDLTRISSGRVGGEPECSSGDYEYPAFGLRLAGGLVAIPRGKRRSYGNKEHQMIYDRVEITEWGNIDTNEKFFGVSVREGRKWLNCKDGPQPVLFGDRKSAEGYRDNLVCRLKSNGLWKDGISTIKKPT